MSDHALSDTKPAAGPDPGRFWRRANPFSLRTTLTAAFTLAALVPALAFGVWFEDAAYRKEIDAVSDRHLLIARNITGALDRYARDVEAAFALFAHVAINDTDFDGFSVLARQLGFRHFCLVDRSGRVVASVAGLSDAPDRLPEAKLGDIVRLAATRPGKIGNVTQDAKGNPVLHLAQPVANGLIVLGTLDTGYFRELQQSVTFGRKGHAAIVDRQGRLLAHPREDWWRSSRNIAGVAPVKRMMRGETGVMTFFSPAANVDMITGYTVVPSAGWGVMVPQPLTELSDAVRDNRHTALWLLAAFVGLAGLGGWIVAGYFLRPVAKVASAARDGALGMPIASTPALPYFAPRELSELIDSYNAMADQIQRDRALQQALANAEKQEMLGRIMANVPGLVLRRVRDRDGNIAYPLLSIGRSNVFGLDADPLMAEPGRFVDCVHPEDRATWRAFEHRIFEKPEPASIEFRIVGRDGVTRWARAIGEPQINEAGDTVWDSVVIDITETRRTEAQLRQAQKMEAVGQLTGGVAHDFNNLLAVMLGNLELLREREPAEPPRLQLLDSAIDAARRGAALTARLLTFSRNQALHPEAVDVDALIEDMRDLLERTLGDTVILDVYARDTDGAVRVDRNMLENVILNLAINARDAMPGGGTLIIATEPVRRAPAIAEDGTLIAGGDYVEISVIDTGVGMSADVRRRAFEPFYTTKEVGRGSGLGLSTVLGFVAQSGGHVELDSEPGNGTTVRLYLPVDEGEPATVAEAATAGIHPVARGTRILLVEDDASVCGTIGATLAELGVEVVAVHSGADARRALLANPPFDAMLTDVSLPGGQNGYELAGFVRERHPAMHVMFMSGYPRGEAGNDGSSEIPSAFLQKPFTRDQLVALLNRTLDGERQAPEA